MQGLLGKKLGMTKVFDENGRQWPVTVLEVGPCVVLQRKTTDKEGYEAVQCGFEAQKESRLTKPRQGQFKKAGAEAMRFIREFSVTADEELKAGDKITAELFDGVSHVDVTALSKGRGFQGAMKRHNFGGGRMTHGGRAKRRPGSIGQASYPARVRKGQKMPGQMGNKRITTQNLKIVQVIAEDNLILVSGAVPGPTGGLVTVLKALKKASKS